VKKIILIILLCNILFGDGAPERVDDNVRFLEHKGWFGKLKDAELFCKNNNARLPTKSEFFFMYSKLDKEKTYWISQDEEYYRCNYKRCVIVNNNIKDSSSFCVLDLHPVVAKQNTMAKSDCSLVLDKLPPKPRVSLYSKRDYETNSEFQASKDRALQRWRIFIKGYHKECTTTIQLINYDVANEQVEFKQNIDLDGLRLQKFGKYFMNISDGKQYYTKDKYMVVVAYLGADENENFVIEKLIFKKDTHKKPILSSNTKLITGILFEDLQINHLDNGIKCIDKLEKGMKISYNPLSNKIVIPKEFNNWNINLKPIFEPMVKDLSLTIEKKKYVSIKIKTNFKITTIKIMPAKENSIECEFTHQFNNKIKIGQYKTSAYRIEENLFSLVIMGKTHQERYECSKKNRKCTKISLEL